MPASVRRFLLAPAIALFALLATGCASGPKPVVDFKQDYNFATVEKIGFYEGSSHVSGDNPMQLSDMQIDRIYSALRKTLVNKGYTVVENATEADLLLSWHLATQQKTDVRTYNTPTYGMSYGVGYGRYNSYARYSCWDCFNTDVRVSNYTEGTLIIDMIDPALEKSVWRSVTQSKLKSKPDESQERYDSVAAIVLSGFPPGSDAVTNK